MFFPDGTEPGFKMWRLGGLSGDDLTTRHSLFHGNSPHPLLSRRAWSSSEAGRCLTVLNMASALQRD